MLGIELNRQRIRIGWLVGWLAIGQVHGCGGIVADPIPNGSGGGGGASGSSSVRVAGGATIGGSTGIAGSVACDARVLWPELPNCAYADCCYSPGGPYVAGTPSDECTITFDAPVADMPFYRLLICGKPYIASVSRPDDDATLSADRTFLALHEPLCKMWQAAQRPQLILMSVHSCVL